jgi:hypothetical protein
MVPPTRPAPLPNFDRDIPGYHFINLGIMSNRTTADATPKSFTKSVKGFTYIKDYACITVELDGSTQKVIIGDKQNFGMSDMFQLKSAESITFVEKDPKTVNGVEYRRFSLESINF